jgi:hypothetical protein
MESKSYEFISETDEAVAGLVGSLPRVEAPGDFDTRVRARIAAGRPATRSWTPAFAGVAVSMALLLALGGYLGYSALYQGETPSSVAETPKSEPAPIADADAGTVIPANDLVAVAPQPQTGDENANRNSSKPPSSSGRTTDRTGGGSFDQATRETKQILPLGLSPDTQNVNSPLGDARVSTTDVFNILGIRAGYTPEGWMVESVTPNNMADRSGVKAGDVVEALNDKPLTERSTFGRTFDGKSVRVRRNGQSIKLELKP